MIVCAIVAIVAFATVLSLGAYARLAPVGIDAHVATRAFGQATRVAWMFTNLGYARELLLVYCVTGAALRIERPRDIAPLAFLAFAQIASQLVSTFLKTIYKRQRPEHWLKRHETSAGYPSGHATTATVTYAGIALGVLLPIDPTIAEPVRDTIAAISAACAAGIAWSRLALGAHYLSDVAGGIMLGTATLSLLAIVIERT